MIAELHLDSVLHDVSQSPSHGYQCAYSSEGRGERDYSNAQDPQLQVTELQGLASVNREFICSR